VCSNCRLLNGFVVILPHVTDGVDITIPSVSIAVSKGRGSKALLQ